MVVTQRGILRGAPHQALVAHRKAAVAAYTAAAYSTGGGDVGNVVDGYRWQAVLRGELLLFSVGCAAGVGGIGADIVDGVGGKSRHHGCERTSTGTVGDMAASLDSGCV